MSAIKLLVTALPLGLMLAMGVAMAGSPPDSGVIVDEQGVLRFSRGMCIGDFDPSLCDDVAPLPVSARVELRLRDLSGRARHAAMCEARVRLPLLAPDQSCRADELRAAAVECTLVVRAARHEIGRLMPYVVARLVHLPLPDAWWRPDWRPVLRYLFT